MNAKELHQLADQCLDWYWTFGSKRSGQYAVSRGSCLDHIYTVKARAEAMAKSGNNVRPCMALWGPSQTGKSTLLASYLDLEDDKMGIESVLTWSEQEPVRFSGELRKDGSNIVINPYNGGSDGSGCISRFVMLDQVPNPLFPVDITLASDMQILHALAAGYESECDTQNKDELNFAWNSDKFRALVDSIKEDGTSSRDGFEAIHRIADVIEMLIRAATPRYVNLRDHWKNNLRPMLLESKKLANQDSLREFAYAFLWDSWPSLCKLCERLLSKRQEITNLLGEKNQIRCTWRLASLLLDIDAYKHYEKNNDLIKTYVDRISFEKLDDGSYGIGQTSGLNLFRTGEDFGLFQGLVWELRLPLRRDRLKERHPIVTAFFETADLMDFPGVSNEHEGVKKISDQILANDWIRGLTEVLKRGKTASIAVSRGASLDIDGFSILARAGRFPGSPKQLDAGVFSWMSAYGEEWPPKNNAMPLNLVITFCAKLVNDICSTGIRNGLDPYFSLFSKLGNLANPKVVTVFATTYPWIRTDGRIQYEPHEYEPKVEEILKDRAYREKFGDNQESFMHMVKDGGTDYFFQRLTEQAKQSRRQLLLQNRLHEAKKLLIELMRPHLASENAASDERNRALDQWIEGIKAKLRIKPENEYEYDPAAKLSQGLRRLLNINPSEMEAIPLRARDKRVGLQAFVMKQLYQWRDNRTTSHELSLLGFTDAAHAQRVFSALIEAANINAVVEFFRENLGNVTSKSMAENSKRYLAIKMSNEMLNLHSNSRYSTKEKQLEVLREFAEAESNQIYTPETSPHYVAAIEPIIKKINQIKEMQVGDRPAQEGDQELSQIFAANIAL
jgi:hypothetical protein